MPERRTITTSLTAAVTAPYANTILLFCRLFWTKYKIKKKKGVKQRSRNQAPRRFASSGWISLQEKRRKAPGATGESSAWWCDTTTAWKTTWRQGTSFRWRSQLSCVEKNCSFDFTFTNYLGGGRNSDLCWISSLFGLWLFLGLWDTLAVAVFPTSTYQGNWRY